MLQNAVSSVPNPWLIRGLQKVAVFNRRGACAAKRHQLCAEFLAESEIPKNCNFRLARGSSRQHFAAEGPSEAHLGRFVDDLLSILHRFPHISGQMFEENIT